MNKWFKKTLVILFTIATFGMVSPPAALMMEEQTSKDTAGSSSEDGKLLASSHEFSVEQLLHLAEEQSYLKFGNKIGPVIEDEFKEVILPKIEETITEFAENDERFLNVILSKKPAGGMGEKIFHIYDAQTGEDLIRFHVRRDNPPHQGFWFNFHYHTYHDSFASHHELGSIYWDKNTPPNWMAN
ncbi:hypothetical protein GJU40_01825 [Bacillus lacus]|uniref:Cell division protein FtsK n=1 Tax=Metabacillus lacus TaxID=1983721 RepID=A0A7X2IW60_9BACI|nr:YpjP family protein [Metabacillus lacus]MRX70906.1 hypothetical protein [Metabacillus lacus]